MNASLHSVCRRRALYCRVVDTRSRAQCHLPAKSTGARLGLLLVQAQRSEAEGTLVEEELAEPMSPAVEEDVDPDAVDDTSTEPRSARCCLRNIKTCTRSSSVSWRARVRNRFLRRSAFRRSFASCFFWLRNSACFFFILPIAAVNASSGKALLIVPVVNAKPAIAPAAAAASETSVPAFTGPAAASPTGAATETISSPSAAPCVPWSSMPELLADMLATGVGYSKQMG